MQILRFISFVILLAGISGCQRTENVSTQGYDEQCAHCKDDACRHRHCGEQIKTQNSDCKECQDFCDSDQNCLNNCHCK
jgi:hypothetical protein